MTFKPMLAADCKGDLSLIRTPCIVSPKLDGVRCVIIKGKAMSRSMKPIPNRAIQDWAHRWQGKLNGLDGELIVGLPTQQPGEETVMSRTMSGVMSNDGDPDFTFFVFDDTNDHRVFDSRISLLQGSHPCKDVPRVQVVPHRVIYTDTALVSAAEQVLFEGYEGLMTRNPSSLYKQGRSTMREQGLVKIKLFETAEAEVIGAEEQMHNDNPKIGAGIQKRGTSAAGLSPAGVLGALVCRRPDGVEFRVGTGFTAAQRNLFWCSHLNGPGLIGQTITYQSFTYGAQDKPRFPSFISFRSKEDLS